MKLPYEISLGARGLQCALRNAKEMKFVSIGGAARGMTAWYRYCRSSKAVMADKLRDW
jgi:hypothetical protein